MDLWEVGYDDRDWINLAQDRDRWRAYRNPIANASYNGWGDHRANHTIPPFWLDDRPPLLRHVGVRPAAG
ncbi:hypothetical protein ANN_23628 [Periplaneta americana]|uniref:Uncharacterized protein n=1 Tax=Periplaneta americana TaxID=6978 RepID=A0ABQ8SLL6_PERAM|nr:hypothetical protein ANN_23628 [Periplaneta americana]